MDEIMSVEEKKLQEAVESGKSVRVITRNGYQMDGVILDFDANVLQMQVRGEDQMVYIGAISTIIFFK